MLGIYRFFLRRGEEEAIADYNACAKKFTSFDTGRCWYCGEEINGAKMVGLDLAIPGPYHVVKCSEIVMNRYQKPKKGGFDLWKS